MKDLNNLWKDRKRVCLKVMDEINCLSKRTNRLSLEENELTKTSSLNQIKLPKPMKQVEKPKDTNKICNKKYKNKTSDILSKTD